MSGFVVVVVVVAVVVGREKNVGIIFKKKISVAKTAAVPPGAPVLRIFFLSERRVCWATIRQLVDRQ